MGKSGKFAHHCELSDQIESDREAKLMACEILEEDDMGHSRIRDIYVKKRRKSNS